MTDREFFGQLCLESLLRQYEEELAQCEPAPRLSAGFRRRMKYLLKHGTLPPKVSPRRRILVAALIAALLFLTACAAVVYGEDILNYWVETYQDHFSISRGSEHTDIHTIQEQYHLHYIPEGYDLAQESITASTVYYSWVNQQEDWMLFTQTIGKSAPSINNNGNTTEKILFGDLTVLHFTDGQYHTYLWSDGIYHYTLYTVFAPSDSEFSNIFSEIKPK